MVKVATLGSVFMLAWSAAAVAHTSATSTTPKSGAVLSESPPTIEITFKEPARLTSVVVVQGGTERKLQFAPANSATTFKTEQPLLPAGKSEVRWTALSKDGHVVKGTIVLTVQAPSAPSS